jgi:hypothetical protein
MGWVLEDGMVWKWAFGNAVLKCVEVFEFLSVMPGLVPGIHASLRGDK